MMKHQNPRQDKAWSTLLVMAAASVICGGRNINGQTPDSTELCCGNVHTQYKRDVIHQLVNLHLSDLGDDSFRCSHRVCAHDRSTDFGVVYFGTTDHVTLTLASCDAENILQSVPNPLPSRKLQIQGPCLCVGLNISSTNVLKPGESTRNSSVIVLASFYAKETNTSPAAGRDETSDVVDVAYTCTASAKSVSNTAETEARRNNATVMAQNRTVTKQDGTVHSPSPNPLSPTAPSAHSSGGRGEAQLVSSSANSSNANESVHHNSTSTEFLVDNTGSTYFAETVKTTIMVDTHAENKTTQSRCYNCGEKDYEQTDTFTAFKTCGQDGDLLGWIVALSVCGAVILFLMVFSIVLLTHYLRYLRKRIGRPVKRRHVTITPLPSALGLEQEAYQNEVFIGSRLNSQSASATQTPRRPPPMITFPNRQSDARSADHVTSRMTTSETYTVDMNRPSMEELRAFAGATNLSSSPECLELDGFSEFSDDDFFFDDFDEFYPNESVI